MKTMIMIAWRNVWRNKRRTVLTLLTILVGCAMIIFQNAFAKGGHDQMIEDAVSVNTGHIQVHEKGYWDNRTIDYAFIPDEAMMKSIALDRRIAGYSVRVHADGLLSHGAETAGAMIQGVDPAAEITVSNIHTKILPGGRYLRPGDTKHIVMGETLAKNCKARVGSIVSMISQGFDGSIAAEKLTVVGLFRSGNPEYDMGLVVMPLRQAQDTFTMMGYAHSLALRLASSDDIDAVRHSLMRRADAGALEVLGWEELMPELVQFIVFDSMGAYIFDFILFLVVAFGILNTIQMAVFERTREFGVMLSIGTRPGQVISMVMFESFFISLMGVILGCIAGYGISYYFKVNPLDYSDYTKEIAVWGVSTVIYPANATALNLAVTGGITMALSMIFSLFPARRAAGLNPIEAIRRL